MMRKLKTIALAAAAVSGLFSSPVSADPRPVVGEVVSADWTRRVEIWWLSGGKTPNWRYDFTHTIRGAYPEMPVWTFPPLISDRPQKEKARSETYALTVDVEEAEKKAIVFVLEEDWIAAAETGSINLMMQEDSEITPLPGRLPRLGMRVWDHF